MLIGLINLIVAFGLSVSTGTRLAGVTVQEGDFPVEGVSEAFEIGADTDMLKIDLYAGVNNSWSWLEVDLLNAEDGKSIGYVAQEVQYYHGVEGGESWSEGDHEWSQTFRAPKPGRYKLALTVEEGDRLVRAKASVTRTPAQFSVPIGMSLAMLGFGLFFALVRAFTEPNLWPSDD
jgi:hypothetical protein